MASIGKITNSLNAMTNENTLALINLNLDISLLRCDAPVEFEPVGLALTSQRREEAETGQLHRTARKLGFLFHDILPSTPKLLKAYGIRASEILSRPDVNPAGTENDGPFRAFVGADCTTIWAAATSSESAIAIHLLACMLARAWEAKVAVSILVELVEARKQHIIKQIEEKKFVNAHTMVVAQQEITRAELAAWDASTRSWLRRADESMALQHRQLALIADNIQVPFTTTGTTFEKVTSSLVNCMQVLEKLMGNLPQQAGDRAVLLAISSWHLYPRLLVFQTQATNVDFGDELFFPSSGVLSLGLEYKGEEASQLTKWSLSLSHLKYYGDPVKVRSNVDTSRILFDEVWLVVLGSHLQRWGITAFNIESSVAWFKELGEALGSEAKALCEKLPWLSRLIQAASSVYDPHGDAIVDKLRLVKYGWRRAHTWLSPNSDLQVPFFGLCSRGTMRALEHDEEIEIGIEFLRSMCSKLNLEPDQYVIQYERKLNYQNQVYCEWASIVPSRCQSLALYKHARCIQIRDGNSLSTTEWNLDSLLEKRSAKIRERGEICIIQADNENGNRPPRLFKDGYNGKMVPLLTPQSSSMNQRPTTKFMLWGTSNNPVANEMLCDRLTNICWETETPQVGIEWLKKRSGKNILQYLVSYLSPASYTTILDIPSSITSRPRTSLKRKTPINDEADTRNQSSDLLPTTGYISSCFHMISGILHPLSGVHRKSLQCLVLAHTIFEHLPQATVPLRVFDRPIPEARWASDIGTFIESGRITSRAHAFACIAMFESGRFNIAPSDLEEVVAICYENSIFVAGALLSDPAENKDATIIRHIIGNIGHAGMVFLISPTEPRIRAPGYNPALVEHRPFDGTSANKFQGTSLHLSFTNWKMPLDWDETGVIDQETFLLEAVVSVQDDGKWVADVDVLVLEKNPITVMDYACQCDDTNEPFLMDVVCLDSWEELLDSPPCVGVLRAKGNWAARLAAASILTQQEKGHCILAINGQRICWKCLNGHFSYPEPHYPQFIIH
ncbi:hypothetical protein F4809DRAFT_605327 [Biscogniauxia mediterranea]|nr:hypothetical protein F4809DRAFT_605327 [Biscogniauxia mediterranea]